MNANKNANKNRHGALRTLVIIALILGLGVAAGWYVWVRPAQASSTTTNVSVKRGDISLSASGSGTLVASQSVNMSFTTAGKVAELNFKLGDKVEVGDVLARLANASDLEANLAAAQLNLLSAQQALEKLQAGGGPVLANAYLALVKAQATYDSALAAERRTTATRCNSEVVQKYADGLTRQMGDLNALTQSVTDAQALSSSAAYIETKHYYETALWNYTYCKSFTQTEQATSQSSLAVAKMALDQAQASYDQLKASAGIDADMLVQNETNVATAQTRVTTAQEALDGITLKASIAGKITYLAAVAGALVDTSTFLTISDISQPTVTVSVDETDMDKLVVDNPAVVTFSALPGKTFTGKVSVAASQMQSFGPFKAASGQVVLDDGAVEVLKALPLGLSATIKITGKQAVGVLLVPVAALKTLRSGDIAVMRVGSDGQAVEQVVTVGLKDDSYAEILSGLSEGDQVRVTVSASTKSNQNNAGFMEGGGPPP